MFFFLGSSIPPPSVSLTVPSLLASPASHLHSYERPTLCVDVVFMYRHSTTSEYTTCVGHYSMLCLRALHFPASRHIHSHGDFLLPSFLDVSLFPNQKQKM